MNSLRDAEVAGSNPAFPTNVLPGGRCSRESHFAPVPLGVLLRALGGQQTALRAFWRHWLLTWLGVDRQREPWVRVAESCLGRLDIHPEAHERRSRRAPQVVKPDAV